MAFSAGSKLGPYEIVAPLGAGGMGEVYRARDTRLDREVAIKVLSASFSSDPERLRRFEQEARAVAALSHPNILAIHDVGTHNGSPYLISELLEGDTLRQRLDGGSVPVRKGLEYAQQIAAGLAAAHEKGIVHRDLKPENIFVTRDGRIKILDFGLAKLAHPEAIAAAQTLGGYGASAQTLPGQVLGTVGYMSPEQVTGVASDHRSDIFSLGAILYEMFGGQRAFKRDSAIATMNAILQEDPPELTGTGRAIPPGLEHIVRHCLEKNPEERFQSARDVAFDLRSLSGASTTSVQAAIAAKQRKAWLLWGTSATVLALAAVAGWWAGSYGHATTEPPSYQRLTYSHGIISNARFAPDGLTVVYRAAWEGAASRLYSLRTDAPGDHDLGLDADVLDISKSGEMALLIEAQVTGGYRRDGVLARMPLSGAAPREVLDHVQDAAWAPDGQQLCVVRNLPEESAQQLEFPSGKVLYKTGGWISHPRVSPDGKLVAFLDHPLANGDDQGQPAVVDSTGKVTKFGKLWVATQGLAWSPGGAEIWFSASESGSDRAIYAMALNGKLRTLARIPGDLGLQDIRPDGELLVARNDNNLAFRGLAPGAKQERDLSYLDWDIARDISRDGKTVLWESEGSGGGPNYTVYVRGTDGSPPLKLSDGIAVAISPDGKWVMTTPNHSPQQLIEVPTGAGNPVQITHDNKDYFGVRWLPDGNHILYCANEPGHPIRCFNMDLQSRQSKPIAPANVRFSRALSADGRTVIVVFQKKAYLWPTDGSWADKSPEQAKPIAGELGDHYRPLAFTPDLRTVYAASARPEDSLPRKVFLYDLSTGAVKLWKSLGPPDLTGVPSVGFPLFSADDSAYVYVYSKAISQLYIVKGVK